MQEKKAEILVFIERSLILSLDVKQRVRDEIETLETEQVERLYFVMTKIDEKQTKILEKKLEKEPWFFMKLQNIISKESYKAHLVEELGELEELEGEFERMLAEVD